MGSKCTLIYKMQNLPFFSPTIQRFKCNKIQAIRKKQHNRFFSRVPPNGGLPSMGEFQKVMDLAIIYTKTFIIHITCSLTNPESIFLIQTRSCIMFNHKAIIFSTTVFANLQNIFIIFTPTGARKQVKTAFRLVCLKLNCNSRKRKKYIHHKQQRLKSIFFLTAHV